MGVGNRWGSEIKKNPWSRGTQIFFRHLWGQNSVFMKTNVSAFRGPPDPHLVTLTFSVSSLSYLETTLVPFLNQG